ncbi:MAG: DoxX family protein [Planctomycetota bacterium]
MTEHTTKVPSRERIADVLGFLLAAVFMLSAFTKLLSFKFQQDRFERWGYSAVVMITVGVIEFLAVFWLLYPPESRKAAWVLIILMTAATFTLLANGEFLYALVPTSVAATLGLFVYLRGNV